MPRGREEIPRHKLGLVGLPTQSRVHSTGEALSGLRGWIKDRKYMAVVKCCRDKCFVTRLFGIVNANAELEYARVVFSG